MKKVMICFCGLITACAATTDAGKGLIKLGQEPKNCEFLYTMTSNAKTYDIDDAYEYLEQSITDQHKQGDSYYIVSETTSSNPSAILGPKQTYNFKVKVYNCNK